MKQLIKNFALPIFLMALMTLSTITTTTAQEGKTYTLDAIEAMKRKENGDNEIPVVTDAELQDRINKLSHQVPMRFNSLVKSHIKAYTERRRSSTETIIGRSSIYFPIFENALIRHGLPSDLKYLAIVESALNPRATSPAGAKGLWQFMKGTGKQYKLRITRYVDERCDPFMASDAAARYLQDLYERYYDWSLAIAAYNCGPGRVNSAIKKAGVNDYWKIARYLPKETRNYVPAFIAAAYTSNYYHLHNLYPTFPEYDLQVTEKVRVYQKLTFAEIARASDTPLKTVKFLNPGYLRDFIPASKNGHLLILPMSKMTAFRAYAPTAQPAYFASSSITMNDAQSQFVASSAPTPAAANATSHIEYEQVKKIYRVKKGDNLGKIASKYGVSVREIRKWNSLKSSLLLVNQKLVIYQTIAIEKPIEPIVTYSQAAPTQASATAPNRIQAAPINTSINSNVANSNASATSSNMTNNANKVEISYDVRRGDTLWQIASRYEGVEVNDLLNWNGIKKHTDLRPGIQLKIFIPKEK